MNILITAAAGCIGIHLSKKRLEQGHQIIGLDNLNDYYDVQLKQDILAILNEYDNFTFYEADLADREAVEAIFDSEKIDVVINLAAQAGVRYSLENPQAYVDSNLVGFVNVLEACRQDRTSVG